MSIEQKSNTDRQQFWQMAIETWQASGLSVSQFCANEKLSEASFYAWRKKLTDSDLVPQEQDNPKYPESEFIEVAIPSNNSLVIEFVLTSGGTLKIPVGVDTKTLTIILSVLHQAGLC
jgi:transposase